LLVRPNEFEPPTEVVNSIL